MYDKYFKSCIKADDLKSLQQLRPSIVNNAQSENKYQALQYTTLLKKCDSAIKKIETNRHKKAK